MIKINEIRFLVEMAMKMVIQVSHFAKKMRPKITPTPKRTIWHTAQCSGGVLAKWTSSIHKRRSWAMSIGYRTKSNARVHRVTEKKNYSPKERTNFMHRFQIKMIPFTMHTYLAVDINFHPQLHSNFLTLQRQHIGLQHWYFTVQLEFF